MVRISSDTNIAILGKIGSGKSMWTTRVLIPALTKQKKGSLVILDAKNEYGKLKGAEVVWTPQALNQLLYSNDKPPKVIRVLISDPTVFTAESMLQAAWAPFGSETKNEVYMPKNPVRVFIEDAPIYYAEMGAKDPPWLKRFYVLGRAASRTICTTCQRTQLVPKGVLNMSEHLIVFKTANYDVENFIRRYYGDEEANAVRGLKRYQYVIISDLLDKPEIYDPISSRGMPKRPAGIEL